LSSLEGVPSERNERVVRDVVGNFDFLRNSVTAGYRGVARVERSIIDTLALGESRVIEAVAGEPVITPARLSFCAVFTITAGLS
jgi:hypothetical protein